MTRLEFLESLQALGLTVERFGEEFGVSRSTAFRYARGETPIRRPIAMLIEAKLREMQPAQSSE